jgi:LytS/YehU family sensor histidine kinase
VENAFKHGLSRSPEAAVLRLAARRDENRLVLEVANDGPAPPAGAAEGVGLGATRRRLAHLYGDRAEFHLVPGADGRGAVARVILPLTT